MENVIQKAVLVSVAENVSRNVNGTPFYNCTIDYNGKQFGAIMYGTVYNKGIAIGSTVSFSIKFLDDDNVLLSVIGQGAIRATVADFAHLQPVA
jgi:hypothetical protein